MTNQVNNETEETKSGGSSATEQAPATAAVTETETATAASTEAEHEEKQNTDIDFGAILEQFEQEQTIYHAGELVEGRVVGISERGILVDFGYKSEGVVPIEEFTGPEGEPTVSVGDTVEVVIRTIHTGDAPPLLSRSDAMTRKAWAEIEAAYKEERPITGKIIDKTKGGLRVDINGIEAFLPGSQIDSRPIRGLDTYIGEEIEAKIIKFSRRRNNIVLSRKVITDEVVNAQKAETLSKLDVGYIVEGTIKNLTEYGAFVDIGGIDGLLHVTDMSWGRIHHPSDQFKPGDHVQVKVLKLDREKEKISLGYKQLLPDPWSTVIEVYPVNAKIKGRVSSVTDYGIFVELEPGVEGLVHVSEISWSKRAQSPKKLFHRGDEVDVQVLGVDTVEKRISLGMKQFQDNPWETVDLRYPVGSKVHGRVRNLTDFGAFVELEEGIDGLVHVSDITWAKKVKHPKELLKKDQEVDAIVTNIDKHGQRLSLSMKDLMPSAWESFVATHRPGDTVRGKVSRFTSFGIFVELGEGLEGLCHISELSDERVESADQVATLGEEMDFKILRIEYEDQKIGLSHRAVGKADEPVVDTKMYSTEAKGGMASLAELANLKFGKTEEEPPVETKKEKNKKARSEPAASETAPETAAETSESPATTDAEEPAEPQIVPSDSGSAAAETPETPAGDEVTPAPEAIEEPASNGERQETEQQTA
jgi:small subunit ribosomal protein S1